jgi:hypothetical protein
LKIFFRALCLVALDAVLDLVPARPASRQRYFCSHSVLFVALVFRLTVALITGLLLPEFGRCISTMHSLWTAKVHSPRLPAFQNMVVARLVRIAFSLRVLVCAVCAHYSSVVSLQSVRCSLSLPLQTFLSI